MQYVLVYHRGIHAFLRPGGQAMRKYCTLHGFLATAALAFVGPMAFAEFVRPEKPGDPLIYGVRDGIFVALHPSGLDGRPEGGPRGLIRVGYEEDGRHYLINYIAVEPTVGSVPGFSELEKGGDGRPGKRFWVGDGLTDGGVGATGNVRGSVERTPAGGVLSLVVYVEPYANGARPVVEISLFEDAPDRVRLRTFSGPDGKPMRRCVLTATMGNQSRCRWLLAPFVWGLRPGPVRRCCGYGFRGEGSLRSGRSPPDDGRRRGRGDLARRVRAARGLAPAGRRLASRGKVDGPVLARRGASTTVRSNAA